MSQSPDFNRVARPYDFISRLVFGNALVESQVSLLNHIPENSHILIVGGGTGWILEEISKIQSAGLNIVYVEVSNKMISLSRKRDVGQNIVHFIHQDIEAYRSEKLFDIIITPFFFDLFTKSDVSKLFLHIHKMLKPNGLWLYTDFVPQKYQTRFWQKMLLKSMYLFFGILSSVEARTLVNMDDYFEKDYTTIVEKWFFGKFIRSNVYQKR
ncbi:class I SAM-dependent methyltransferase [Dyadobacter sp. CY345]|uniref:class I SAM-dependent methyltransferase n=1 Tax=Dyadobacter sp. CY345 TaxID=2909335 RepID=UPI001F401C64|nr:class I SAM-dependent methyltransferase [Dyadobacter sp. CY345]MCF2444774.1 class I SAM-dependent methyltransferase [Dyadobacter sp. CY345]